MYKIFKPLLFCLQPEPAHKITMNLLKVLRYIPFSGYLLRLFYNYQHPVLEREVLGIKFKNPVGLAAGFDKNGDMFNDMANFGFSFIEIGSLTPLPQEGNPRPRCFRLPKDKAIINRMGINNMGVKHAVEYIKQHRPQCIIGGNISKNSSVSNENAPRDYEKSFSLLYDFVDFFVLNVSCPNVKDLCKLQDISSLSEIIDKLLALRRYYDEYRPILLKVSPDITYPQLDEIIDLVLVSGLDGVIATNTTRNREGLVSDPATVAQIGAGGLSGAPLFEKSLERIRYIHRKTEGQLPIIAVGGIMSAEQAETMLEAGASLVEIYSGFIYNGPGFVKKINKHLTNKFLEKQNKKQADLPS